MSTDGKKIAAYLRKHPQAGVAHVARKFKRSASYIRTLRVTENLPKLTGNSPVLNDIKRRTKLDALVVIKLLLNSFSTNSTSQILTKLLHRPILPNNIAYHAPKASNCIPTDLQREQLRALLQKNRNLAQFAEQL